MSDHRRHRAVAQRRDQAQRVPDKIRKAKRIEVAGVRIVPSRGASVATLIGGYYVISRCRQRQHHFAPTVGEFRESMQKQDAFVWKPASSACIARPLTLLTIRERMPGGNVALP